MQLKRVVVTGMGAITPLGNSITEYWKKYRRVLQVMTDGGAVCTISERRPEAAEWKN